MTERKKYPAEFKQRVVDLVIDSGRPIAQVSVDIGVNEGTLGNWVRKYRQEHPEEFANKTPDSAASISSSPGRPSFAIFHLCQKLTRGVATTD